MLSVPTQVIESEVQHGAEAANISVVRRYEEPFFPQRRRGAGWMSGSWLAIAMAGGMALGLAAGWMATPGTPGSSPNRVQTRAITFPAQGLHATEIVPVGRAQTTVPVYYRSSSAKSSDSTSLKSSVDAAGDLEAVKIRNRRLEALVKVLRHRTSTNRRAPASLPNSN